MHSTVVAMLSRGGSVSHHPSLHHVKAAASDNELITCT